MCKYRVGVKVRYVVKRKKKIGIVTNAFHVSVLNEIFYEIDTLPNKRITEDKIIAIAQ